jgi:hypothetical protein
MIYQVVTKPDIILENFTVPASAVLGFNPVSTVDANPSPFSVVNTIRVLSSCGSTPAINIGMLVAGTYIDTINLISGLGPACHVQVFRGTEPSVFTGVLTAPLENWKSIKDKTINSHLTSEGL